MDMAFHDEFQPLLGKHSKSFSLVDAMSVGVHRMQRNVEPMRQQVETWRGRQLTSATAKLIIYWAFVQNELDAPKQLALHVHELCFPPPHEGFQPRTTWCPASVGNGRSVLPLSLSNAFASAFKELGPIPQFKTTAKLGVFLEAVGGA